MKLFFIKGNDDYDQEDPILVLADTKEEAEKLAKPKEVKSKYFAWGFAEIIFENNSPKEKGKAGEGYKLKKGVIWKQFNAG